MAADRTKAPEAVLAAALAAALTVTLLFAIWGSQTPEGFVIISAITFTVTILCASTLGMAWHALAIRLRTTSVVWYGFAGLTVASCLSAALIDSASVFVGPAGNLGEKVQRLAEFSLAPWLFGSLAGAVAGATAWLIRRPDRDAV